MKFPFALSICAIALASFAFNEAEAAPPLQDAPETAAKSSINNPSSEHLEASYRLLDNSKYTEQLKAMMGPLALTFFDEGLEQSTRRNGVELDATLKTKLREAFVSELEKIVDAFASSTRIEAGFVYTKYFTIEEINRLIEINKDPVMLKATRIASAMQTELAKLGMENMREYQPQLEERMKEITEQYLADIMAEESS